LNFGFPVHILVNLMFCLELIKFDVSNSSYYVEVENGALLRDFTRSWEMILGGHGKLWKIFREKVCW